LGLVLWVAMLEAGVEAALAGILIALAVPLHGPGSHGPSPLREAERCLHPWGVLIVVPLFAFFNAGIAIDTGVSTSLFSSVSVGILGGLFLGKQIGVLGVAWVAVSLGLGQLPAGVNWGQIYGAALLAGIGFTMSLFVASLAFSDVALIASAKIAILAGSFVSAVTGLGVIYLTTRKPQQAQAQAATLREPVS
jgi:NhaA family Na+:H+ antiporter